MQSTPMESGVMLPVHRRAPNSPTWVPEDRYDVGIYRTSLADPAPTIEHDAPSSIPADTRVAVEWTATDASGNADSKLQLVTARAPRARRDILIPGLYSGSPRGP